MKNILLVEDKHSMLEMLTDALNDEGHTVTPAGDGLIALEHINDNPAGYFDVIVSDIVMPNVDGIEFVTGLRATNNKTPVLFISGGGYNMTARNILNNAQSLANSILQKPFSPSDLLKAIDKVTA